MSEAKVACDSEREARSVSFSVDLNGDRHPIYFKFRGSEPEFSPEAYVAAALFPAMKLGKSLKIKEPISARFLENTGKIQDIFHCWYKDFKKIAIESEDQDAKVSKEKNRGVGCFFSGGVDSFYTLFKRRNEITSLIFVHGFDISLHDERRRSTVASVFREVGREVGIPLIEVETNLREFSDKYVNWGKHYHGAALASVALLLSPQFRKIYIPSSDDYSTLVPWGSHALLDPLWSTESTAIVEDGAESNRLEKTAAIVTHDIVRKSLHVCWENLNDSYNCGECGKCLRVMANLRVLGMLDQVKTFDCPLDLKRLARTPLHDPGIRRSVEYTLEAVRRANQDRALENALEDMLSGIYSRGLRAWPRRMANSFLRSARGRRK